MKIKSLRIKKFHGFDFSINFIEKKKDNGSCCIIGLNGSGKTTILNLIAGLSGNDLATKLIAGEDVGYAKIVIVEGKEEFVFETKSRFDYDEIIEFKKMLPNRTSYVLMSNLEETRLVTKVRDPLELFDEMKEWLAHFCVPLEDSFYFREGYGADLMIGSTSAQRYLFLASFRKAPSDTPMLIDYIERNVHVVRREILNNFYRMDDTQQIIATTHCPFILASFQKSGGKIISLS